jgi:hypothetical protein
MRPVIVKIVGAVTTQAASPPPFSALTDRDEQGLRGIRHEQERRCDEARELD